MIRPLDQKDLPEVLKRFKDLSDEDKIWYHPHPFTMDALKQLLTEKGNYFFVKEHKGLLIGYSMLRTFNKYLIPTYGGIIWEPYRGKGYGAELLDETLAQAKHLGFTTVKLKVFKTNKRAFQLYQEHGFSVIGEEGPEWWMEKTLD
jgi:ribosomal protein S18 acetylase RimI-like enzyme